MPTKKEIEAELNASEQEKLLASWRNAMAILLENEKRVWQPHWSENDPLIARLRRAGLSEAQVKEAELIIDLIYAYGTADPVPPEAQKIAERTGAAQQSALDQLNKVLAEAKKR
jgi:hypothetical protein